MRAEEETGLERSLRQRHMTMISLGGVIGAGLFVGSGAVMNQTGPAAFVSYLLAGVLVVLVMRMLGEMAVANPAIGSFIEYRRTALGPRAGFTIGWLYWWFWAIVLAIRSRSRRSSSSSPSSPATCSASAPATRPACRT
jgi:GABA permease